MVFLPTFLKKERTSPVSKNCLLGKLEKRIRPSGVFRYKPRDSRSENSETLNNLNTKSGTVAWVGAKLEVKKLKVKIEF